METTPSSGLIAFGSNLGDSAQMLEQAQQQLANLDDVEWVAASLPRQTPPIGGEPDQPGYLNAVWRINTCLAPAELLERLQSIEQSLGRRRERRWAPRTADLDLLLLGDSVVQSEWLTLPHPRMSFRRFVLEPAVEVAAELVHPVIGASLGELLECIDQRPDRMGWLLPRRWEGRPELDRWRDELHGRHPGWGFEKIFSEKDFLEKSPQLKLLVRFPAATEGGPAAAEPWLSLPFRGPTLRLNHLEQTVPELAAAIDAMLPWRPA